ncbi:kinase-like protein [Rhizoclosmatium globosum]|uniref:Kinase-like protein n=1 Tax=Rhizoclosmatium globosum TaxID=329046 RepID=A0A1Y2CPX1_9FUNG|nr:kinase-like protein [Rhizoclosmatium globosum]|eukprot:ORY49090.1 kinase-like protein [Rhizoclosmatium globosum]
MHPLQTPFHTHKIPFSSGSSDLWAWSYATRAFMHETTAGCGATLIPERAVKRIVVQVAQALKEMHGCGYFHGDVKIENVLVGYRDDCVDDGCGGVEVRLADFGHVRHWMRGMDAYGTREVSPPEFLSGFVGESPVDGRKADVFALGVLMFMLLSDEGQLPSAVRVFRAGGLGYESLLALHHGFYPLDDIGLEPVPMSLLYAMTRVDPDTRYSIDDVLAHPYLADVV